jgi:hypothetical protein
MNVIFRLVDGAGEYPCEISGDHWRVLLAFRTFAQELCNTRLLAAPGRWDFGMSWSDGDDGVTFHARQMPDPDDFRAFLLLMRPFVLNNEPTFYPRVRNILCRHLHSTPFQEFLDEQLRIFQGKRCQSFTVVSDGVVLNSDETLMKWLNAYEYHRDHEKRQALEQLHDVWPLGFSKGMWGVMMLHKARAVVELAGWILAAERGLRCQPLPPWPSPEWERGGLR